MRISKSVNYDEIGDQIVITKIKDDGKLDISRAFVVEGVAKEIFLLINQQKNRDEIIDEIAEQYNAPVEKIASDVDTFLSQLKGRGIIDE